jgi:2Fe-2S ferredoxin
MPKITLQPSQRVLEAPKKVNLLKFLLENEVTVGNACGGKGLCASCKVTVLEGESSLSRPNDKEVELSERNHLQKNERIACQSKVTGDLTLTTSYWGEDDFKEGVN